MHERACTELFFGEHPNQNNKRFQRDEFIAEKASVNLKSLETSNPKTTSDFNAMNLSRGKQTPITRNIQKSKTTSEFNARQSSPRLKLE
jgi:hypothetical protein